MNPLLLRCAGALLAVFSLSLQADAAPILIDSFVNPLSQVAQTSMDTDAVFNGTASTSALGGTRELYVENQSLSAFGEYRVAAGFGQGIFGNGTAAGTATGALVWDGVADSSGGTNGSSGFGRGLASIDLTDGGMNNAFRFSTLSSVGTMTMWINLNIGGAGFATSGPLQLSGLVGGPFSVLFTSFGLADLTDVTGIQVYFDNRTTANAVNTPGADINFSFLEVTNVPEPGAIALLGTGLVGLATAARRRLKRQ